jgi:Rv0078B-related antitoxin
MNARRPIVEILDPLVVQILRNKTPAERLAQAFRMWETARAIVRASVRQQHPDWSEEEILRETARRLSHGATERVLR